MEIFFVIGFAFFLGFLLIFATSLSSNKSAEGTGTLPEIDRLPYDRFVRICRDLVEAMKLEVKDIEENQDDLQVDIYAENPTPITGGQFLVHCVLCKPNDITPSAEVVELSNAIIQGRLSKGIFLTTGRFSEELPTISELAPIEFIDGNRLEELAKKYRIPLQVPA